MRNNLAGTSRYGLLCCALVLAGILPGLLGLQSSICNSVIKDVTIGGNNAEIVRTFSVKDVPRGPQTIIVNHLPNTIDEQSIEISGTGDGTIVSTVLQNQVLMRGDNTDYNAALRSLQMLSRAIAEFTVNLDREETLANARASAVALYVEDVVSRNPAKTAPSSLSLTALMEVLDLQDKELKAAHDRVAQVQAVRSVVKQWAAAAQNMADALSTTGVYANVLSELPLASTTAPKSLVPGLRALEALISELPKDSSTWPALTQSKELHINVHSPKTDDDRGA
jgi:hypothetical protein